MQYPLTVRLQDSKLDRRRARERGVAYRHLGAMLCNAFVDENDSSIACICSPCCDAWEGLMKTMLARGLLTLLLLMQAGIVYAQNPATKTDCILGASGVILVTVFQSPHFSLESRIPESGMASYNLLSGLTERGTQRGVRVH
jgi:hypothetical protein